MAECVLLGRVRFLWMAGVFSSLSVRRDHGLMKVD